MKRMSIFKMVLTCMTLYSMPLMAENSDYSKWKHVLYVEPLSVQQGATSCTLSVKMNNEKEAQGFGFSIYLPESFSFATKDNGKPDVRLSMERTDESHIDQFSSEFQADGSVKVTAYGQEGDGLITGNKGEVATIRILIPADCPTGDYVITITEPIVTLTTGLPAEWETDEVFSTLTISSRKIFDENSDNADALKAATGVDVKVKRTIKANEWSTICLPFAMSEAQVKAAFGDDVEIADFDGIETTYGDVDESIVNSIKVKFISSTAIEANHPYIIKVSSPVTEFTVDNVDIVVEDIPSVDRDEYSYQVLVGKNKYETRYMYNSFVGTYTAGMTVPELSLFLNDNKFWYSTGQTIIKAFRAYFDFYEWLPDAEKANSRIHFVFDDNMATDISDVRWKKEDVRGEVFDLQGRKVQKTVKGLYIKNGRKEVIK